MAQLKDFVQDDNVLENGNSAFDSKPIADLFPEATVMFADIVGFTAWSSVREPTQVFSLLETVYHSFDEIARSRRVFKVETVSPLLYWESMENSNMIVSNKCLFSCKQ